MTYQPIENYGIIGNMQTVALIGMDGSIDWLCLPHFDSPSVFASILDDTKGGCFAISPCGGGVITRKQLYWPDTNVLVTRFFSVDGVAEITDFMPVDSALQGLDGHPLIRHVRTERGAMPFHLECRPAFNYARDPHSMEINSEGVCFHSPSLDLSLSSSIPLMRNGMCVTADFTLNEGETATFMLQVVPPGEKCLPALMEEQAHDAFKRTADFWRRWLAKCTYRGRWREIVHRSALALKLLTFEPSGAIVAAPTCSLPESLGGSRNWDYRYTWMRDAAFTLYAFLRIGFDEEAARFMNWLDARCHELEPGTSLQVFYAIDGHREMGEEVLHHLEGYRGSRPVRVGNSAYNQLQLDIYGELMDSVYLFNKYGSPISSDLWTHLRSLVNWVCDNWQQPDEGIWEVRSGRKHFVYSKLMCWVALDRGLRLADKRSLPASRDRWLRVRDAIYQEILDRGWSSRKQSFVQHYGSETLDASALIMPLVFFMSPTDPRMLQTIDAINRSPAKGGLLSSNLVYRYNAMEALDGLDGNEGTFNMCTFWLVEALTRAGRSNPAMLEEARLIFERMLGFANHLGLYSEETSPTGKALGNFPQAFTHLSLISAAFNLDRALGSSG